MSRSKNTIFFVTDGKTTTPFLKQYQLSYIDWEKYEIPPKQGSQYLISIEGNTFQVRELLRSYEYSWSPTNRMWGKHVSADIYSEKKLLEEQWVKESSDISITVTDEFGKKIVCKKL
jgi:hypothetical protein